MGGVSGCNGQINKNKNDTKENIPEAQTTRLNASFGLFFGWQVVVRRQVVCEVASRAVRWWVSIKRIKILKIKIKETYF